MKHLKRLNWLAQDQQLYDTSLYFGLVLIIISCGIMNLMKHFANEIIATKIFFFVLACAFVLIGYGLKYKNKLCEIFYYLSFYHLIDEMLGLACTFYFYEIIAAVITIIWVLFKNKLKCICRWKHLE